MAGTHTTATLGLLHPGSMGAAIGAQAHAHGVEVLWCAANRSDTSRERARLAGLTEVPQLAALTRRSDIIMSVCPPAHAEEVANTVADLSFHGIYVEGNAISPERASRIAARLRDAEAFIDGSLIGSPPSTTKTARLYLSGAERAAQRVAALFTGTAVDVRLLGREPGNASALKMAYSSYQKTSRVLAAVAYALASDHGVQDELLNIASLRRQSYLSETSYIPKVAARSWRWSPEMREAADALRNASLPAELAEAAAAIMSYWEGDKDSSLSVAEALAHLHNHE